MLGHIPATLGALGENLLVIIIQQQGPQTDTHTQLITHAHASHREEKACAHICTRRVCEVTVTTSATQWWEEEAALTGRPAVP